MKMNPVITLFVCFLLLQNLAIAQLSRLIGNANYTYSGSGYILSDTTAYYYSHSRGGDLVHPLCFDSSNTWKLSGSTLTLHHHVNKNYSPSALFAAKYLLTDGTAVYTDTAAAAPLNGTYKYLVEYNPSETAKAVMCLQLNTIGAWEPRWRHTYFYNPGIDSNVAQDIFQTGTGSTWNNFYKRGFTYNTAVNTSQQIDFDFTQGTFYKTNDFDFTIHCGNNLTKSQKTSWSGISFDIFTDSFSYNYNSAGELIARKYWRVTASGIVNDSNSYYSNFTTGHMPQTEVVLVWNGTTWDSVLRYSYTYNSFNQATSQLADTYTGTAWAPGPTLSYYYYEPYMPSGIEKHAKDAAILLYPNPSQQTLNIHLQFAKAQPFTIAVYDATGKLMLEDRMPAASQYTGSIPTQKFPDGNYIIQVTGTEERVSREITVSH